MSDNAQSQIYDCLIQDAINFMQSLSEYYGREQGLAHWDQISAALGHEIKTDIFMRLLTGGVRKTITLSRGIQSQANAIKVIKVIRQASGLGLKEAKDFWDQTGQGKTVRFDMEPGLAMKKSEFISEFQLLGMTAF